MTRHMGGRIPDTTDDRDFNARLLVPTAIKMPKTYLVDKHPKIYNQGQTPKCVTNACAGVKTDEEYRATGKRLNFDADWLYAECKKVDGIPNQDGTYARVACKIMMGQMKLVGQPPDPSWRIGGYYRIMPGELISNIQQIIYQYGTILFGINWYESWMNMFLKKTFPKPDVVCGGHEVRIPGWDEVGFVVDNSWGKLQWGIGGVSTMQYEQFEKSLQTGDCWKVVDYLQPLHAKASNQYSIGSSNILTLSQVHRGI